jgi:hypothetical protein
MVYRGVRAPRLGQRSTGQSDPDEHDDHSEQQLRGDQSVMMRSLSTQDRRQRLLAQDELALPRSCGALSSPGAGTLEQ